MKNLISNLSKWETRNVKNNIRYLGWTIAWVGTMILADKAVLYEWHSSEWISIMAIIFNTAIGLGMIIMFLQLLKGMDELQRNIQLNSLALSTGVGIVGSFTFSLMATSKIIIDVEYSDILLLMVLTYMASLFISQIRYR